MLHFLYPLPSYFMVVRYKFSITLFYNSLKIILKWMLDAIGCVYVSKCAPWKKNWKIFYYFSILVSTSHYAKRYSGVT